MFLLFTIIVFIFVPLWARAQDDDEPDMKIDQAMQTMLNNHPYRVSIFWVLPEINIHSGYDSNGLYAPSGEVTGDYFFSVAPGGSFGLRFGKRAFLVIDEHINFVYYKELDQLRDIFNSTAVRFTTGSRRTLFTLRGGYVSRKRGVDSEFDVPVQQKAATGGSDFELGLGEKTNLGFHFDTGQFLYDEAADHSGLISLPPDHRYYRYTNSFEFIIHPVMAITASAGYGRTEFLDRDQERNTYRFLSGIRIFGPTIKGQLKAGYGETEGSRDTSEENLKSFIGSGDLDFLIREKSTVGVFFRRDHDVSRLAAGNFRITTEGGVRLAFPVAYKMFADASYRVSKNDYGEAPIAEDIVNLQDTVHSLRAGLNYYLMRNLILRGGGIYYNRESNFRAVEKNRFAYDLGIQYVVTP
jgi:hypothetical protein